MRQVDLDIRGLGVVLYSPFALAHIPEGSNFLQEHFWEPGDVARWVQGCQVTGFCTGSPGRFRMTFLVGKPDEEEVRRAQFKLRLGLEVREGVVCVRDLFDLLKWTPECPAPRKIRLADGFYRLTVCSSPPSSGLLGDDQEIVLWMELVTGKPDLKWEGVPSLYWT